jgi:hypothetical protein
MTCKGRSGNLHDAGQRFAGFLFRRRGVACDVDQGPERGRDLRAAGKVPAAVVAQASRSPKQARENVDLGPLKAQLGDALLAQK